LQTCSTSPGKLKGVIISPIQRQLDHSSCALEIQSLCIENRGYQLKTEAILFIAEYTQTLLNQIISNQILSPGKITLDISIEQPWQQKTRHSPGQQLHTSRKESEDLRTPLCHLIHLISDLKCDLDLYDLSACAIYQPVNWKFSNDKDGGKKGTQEFHMNFIVQFTGKRSRK